MLHQRIDIGAGFRANGGDQDRTQTVDGQHLDAPSFALTSAKTSSKSRRERACRSSKDSCGDFISTACSRVCASRHKSGRLFFSQKMQATVSGGYLSV